MTDDFQEWFEAIWTDREDNVYRSAFGDLGEGIFTATAEIYTRDLKQQDFHPGWLHHGVFQCPPTDARSSWLYVTSGLSNPWNVEPGQVDPSGFSGVGFELVFECTEQAAWAVPVLHRLMAYELLVAVGRFPDAELFEYGNRIPLNASIAPHLGSPITWLLVEAPKTFSQSFDVASGRVDFYQLVGMTDSEAAYCAEMGNAALTQKLEAETAWPTTDPRRAPVIP